MKILKYLIILLLVLAGVWTVMCAMAPGSLQVERSITIESPATVAFDEVNCLDRWPTWSPWAEMDPNMTNEYSENPCGAGAWNSWVGEKAGTGIQKIVEVTHGSFLKTELEFDDHGVNSSEWKFIEADGSTTVAWNFIGAETPFMMRGINLMMKGMLEEAYETGLLNLKELCESAESAISYEISEIEIPEARYLLISGDVEPQNIGDFYGENFGRIMAYMGENGIEMAGNPSGLFYSWTDTLAKMSAAIPIGADAAGTDEIEFRLIEATTGLQIDYYGAYDKSEAAHIDMDRHMDANGLELNGAVREVYITDPTTEPDTSKWLTQIIYPVKANE